MKDYANRLTAAFALMAILLMALLSLMPAAFGDTLDEMARKLAGPGRVAPAIEPLALGAHALVSKDNSIAISAYGGVLTVEGAVYNAHKMTLVFTEPTASRTVTFADGSGTVALSQASRAVSLTGDNQAVTVGAASRIQLASDHGTAANRTFTLSVTGAITGQIYVLIAPATNLCELADTGIQKLSATWSPSADDTLTLVFDGTNFLEIARSAN